MTNKNIRKVFGDTEVKDPSLVFQAGLMYDHYKKKALKKLWKEAEKRGPAQDPTFKPDELFFQEEIQDGLIWYSFRFYTPKSNIVERVLH